MYEKGNFEKKVLLARKCVLKFQAESLRLFLAKSLNFAVIDITQTSDKPWSRLRATVNKNAKKNLNVRIVNKIFFKI